MILPSNGISAPPSRSVDLNTSCFSLSFEELALANSPPSLLSFEFARVFCSCAIRSVVDFPVTLLTSRDFCVFHNCACTSSSSRAARCPSSASARDASPAAFSRARRSASRRHSSASRSAALRPLHPGPAQEAQARLAPGAPLLLGGGQLSPALRHGRDLIGRLRDRSEGTLGVIAEFVLRLVHSLDRAVRRLWW